MRRRLLLAATALPLSIATVLAASAAAPGCGSDEPPIDDVCDWIRDPANCYRTLHDETQTRCGATFDDLAASDVKNSEPKGSFLQRDALDVCVLENGGQVQFDQLPTLDQFPVTSLAFTRLDRRSEPCAQITYKNDANISVTLFPCTNTPQDVFPVCFDNLTGTDSVSGYGRDHEAVVGGAYSSASEEGRDIYNVTCPANADGEVKTYRFNLYESGKCTGYTQYLPHVEIDSDPGGTPPPWTTADELEQYVGWVRFRLNYPSLGTEPLVEGGDPDVIQYFNCTIPPQNPCDDGIKDFFESDVDCGGPPGGVPAPEVPGEIVQFSCDRCEIGQICGCTADCKEGLCVLDGVTGFNKCTNEDDIPANAMIQNTCVYLVPPGGSGGGGAGGGGGGGGG
jgi:hypothetical protein